MDDLISKKELLSLTGISYGQLYRWKRKKIIPESWFIKKSVPSGQETFFPKEKILERIQYILDKKNGASLDELGEVFSEEVGVVSFDLEKLIEQEILTDQAVRYYKECTRKNEIENITEGIGAKLFKEQVVEGRISLDEGIKLDRFLGEHAEILHGEDASIFLIRYMGMPLVIGSKNRDEMIFSDDYKVILEWQVGKEVNELKKHIRTFN